MKAKHEIELDAKGNWKPVKGLKKPGRDTVSITGVQVILAALYLIDENREASWASQYITAKIAVNQNVYSKMTCGN